MNWQTIHPQKRLHLMAALILVVGLGAALAIYLTAEDPVENELIYAFEHSKKYVRDLELYGGKLNVMANELSRWFDGLWQGTSLAYTVACISLIVSGGIRIVAQYLP